jgi:hypothetical protein
VLTDDNEKHFIVRVGPITKLTGMVNHSEELLPFSPPSVKQEVNALLNTVSTLQLQLYWVFKDAVVLNFQRWYGQFFVLVYTCSANLLEGFNSYKLQKLIFIIHFTQCTTLSINTGPMCTFW